MRKTRTAEALTHFPEHGPATSLLQPIVGLTGLVLPAFFMACGRWFGPEATDMVRNGERHAGGALGFLD